MIKTEKISLYKQYENNELVWESEYNLFEEGQNDPFQFTYNNEREIYWRYDLMNIPIIFHNIWWDIILILFKLYDLKIWKSNKSENTSNKFKLKVYVLQLLGGYSKLNMYEKIESDLENHYTNTNSNFENIIAFEKKLLKLCDKNNANSLNLILEKLLTNVSNQYNLTLDVSKKIDNIIYGEPQEIIEEPYDYEDYKLSDQKNKKIRIIENDVTNLEDSKKEFTSNFQFNVILIYIISMEIIIKLIYDLIKNIREYPINKNYQDKLKILLFASIRSYIQAVTFYKENFLKFNLDYIKLDFPHDNLSTLHKDINEKDFISINLLFSGIKIDYNTLIINKKNIEDKPISKQKSKNSLDRNTFREYSTSVRDRKKSNNNINLTTLKRNFSTSLIRSNNLLKSMRDNKELNNVNNKNINYN